MADIINIRNLHPVSKASHFTNSLDMANFGDALSFNDRVAYGPPRETHRTEDKLVWQDTEMEDDVAKDVLLDELKSEVEGVPSLEPLEYLKVAEVGLSSVCP